MALDQYNQEGQDMLNQYAMVGDMADDEYGKYQDALNQYWQNLSYLKGQADDAYQMGLQADSTGYERQQDAYGNLVSLITTTGYTPTAEELSAAGMSEGEMNAYLGYYTQQNAPTGGSGGSGGSRGSGGTGGTGGSGGSYNNLSYTTEQVKAAQRFIGVTADGMWGAESAAAAKKKGYGHLGAVIGAMEDREATANIPSVQPAISDTAAAKTFRAGLMTGNEFARHNGQVTMGGKPYKFSNYTEYINAALDQEMAAGRLSDNDVAFLISYYRL
jgi:hypothetical protein